MEAASKGHSMHRKALPRPIGWSRFYLVQAAANGTREPWCRDSLLHCMAEGMVSGPVDCLTRPMIHPGRSAVSYMISPKPIILKPFIGDDESWQVWIKGKYQQPC